MFSNRRLIFTACAALASWFYCAGAYAAKESSRIRAGKTYFEKGRLEPALKEFEAAGGDPEAMYYRYRIYFEFLHDTQAARSVAESIQKLFPGSEQAQLVSGFLSLVKEPLPPAAEPAAPVKEKPAAVVEAKPETKPVQAPKVQAKAQAKLEPRPEPKPEPKPEVKPAAKSDTKPEVKPESKPESKPDTKLEPKPEIKPEPKPAPVVPKEKEPVVQVNLTADLKDFLKGISELTGENILFDQNVGGQVIMSGPADVPLSQVLDLAQQVLAMRGFTLVKMDQGWKVMPSSTALRANIPTHDIESRGMSQEIITQIIRVDSRLSLNEVRALLSSYISPNNNFQVMPKLNLLILTDTRENIQKVLDLIRRLEELQARVVYKAYPLKFAKVTDLKSRLDSILSSFLGKADYLTFPIVETNMLWIVALPEDLQRIEALIKEMDTDFAYEVQLTVIPLKHASEEAVAKLIGELLQVGTARYATENFKIIPDPRRRSVILSSTSPHLVALVSKLVGEIDQPSVPRAENIHIYKIGNADALKIADKLNTLYKDQTGADRIGIVADEQSNSLIITANSQRYAELETVIQKLDQSKPQVWLEVYVVEASEDMTKKIGVQWFAESTKSVRGSNYTGGLGVITGTTPGQEGLSIGLAKAGVALPSAFNAFLDNKDFDVISTPHLLVKDNEEAKISVGDVIPILQNSQVTPTGSVTRSFAFENVGTNLTITPHVNEPRVTLDFTMAIQEVKSVAEIGAPTRTNRDISTTITVESAQTVVLGGILGTRKTSGRSGLPILSRLPGIGWMFRKDVVENKKTNLLIFITPKIIGTAVELENISNEKRAESTSSKMPPTVPHLESHSNPDHREHSSPPQQKQKPEPPSKQYWTP